MRPSVFRCFHAYNTIVGRSGQIKIFRGGIFFNADFIPPNKYHKLYIKNWFLVLYQVKDNTVYIDWIVDCRQDYPWLLK